MENQVVNPWNSLEILKLIVGGLTPIILLFIGLRLNTKMKKFEHSQWRNQKLIEKRLSIYDDIAPLLNDLLCYFTYVGYWNNCKPTEIVTLKRIIDKKMYLAKPLFSEDLFIEVMAFIDLCYKPYQGWGQSAKLRTAFERRKTAFGKDWETQWEDLFIINGDEIVNYELLRQNYSKIMEIFSNEIGLNDIKK